MEIEPIRQEAVKNIPVPTEETFPMLMQVELIRESGLEPQIWIDQFAEGFRKMLKSDPAFFRKYLSDPEGARESIKKQLGVSETIH